MTQKLLVLTSKLPTSWNHSTAHAIFLIDFHFFDGVIAMGEQRP